MFIRIFERSYKYPPPPPQIHHNSNVLQCLIHFKKLHFKSCFSITIDKENISLGDVFHQRNKLHFSGGSMSDKYLQQEIYIAKSAVLTFVFFSLSVAIPNIVYAILGTSGLLGNNTFWIMGKLILFIIKKWSYQNMEVLHHTITHLMMHEDELKLFVVDVHHLVHLFFLIRP